MERVTELAFKLDYPVEFGGKTYEEFTIHRQRGKDLVAMDAVEGDRRKMFAMYASMASVPLGVIEEMDADDVERFAVEIMPLLGKSARAMITAALAQADAMVAESP